MSQRQTPVPACMQGPARRRVRTKAWPSIARAGVRVYVRICVHLLISTRTYVQPYTYIYVCTRIALRARAPARACMQLRNCKMKRGDQKTLDAWVGEKRRKVSSMDSKVSDSESELTTTCTASTSNVNSDSDSEPPPLDLVPYVSRAEETETSTSSDLVSLGSDCTTLCCFEDQTVYQPTEKAILTLFVNKGRNFLPAWYKKFKWITLCTTKKKIFCVYCRFAHKHKLFTFSKRGDDAFTIKGFDNFKKAVEKFRIHENSDSHLEARIKFRSLSNPSVVEQISSEVAKVQAARRAGLLKQLEAMRFLLRQGIALRGHSEEEGNLHQLLTVWSGDRTAMKSWIEEGKYMSHEIVNELITLMGHKVLRQLLANIKRSDPCWYSIIAD